MKRKHLIASAACILSIILFWVCTPKDDEPAPVESTGHPVKFQVFQSTNNSIKRNGSVVIATKNPVTGEMRLLADKLVKELSDGTPVTYFILRKTGFESGFIRAGRDATGMYKSEGYTTCPEGSYGLALNFADSVVKRIRCEGSCDKCYPIGETAGCICPVKIDISNLVFFNAFGYPVEPPELVKGDHGECKLLAPNESVHLSQVIR